MRFFITTLLGVLLVYGSFGQSWCASDSLLRAYLNANPDNKIQYEKELSALNELAANPGSRSGEKHIIPVVFHVLWSTCDDNISIAQIEDGLRIINEDFNRRNADSALTRDVFKPHAANSEIEFRLARFDPSGNATDGVVRIQTNATINALESVKSLSYWPSNQYMNIWVVRSIYSGGSAGTILGYARFPGTGSANQYGVVIRHDAVGTIGTSNADGRTLTHELGHCLNLHHTFNDGCGFNCVSSGDYVCDTPPAADATYDCNTSTNTCSNDASGNSFYSSSTPDMIENYMSYNSCQNLFTNGQKTRMKAVLNSYSSLINLCGESNLIATGVVGLISADFRTSSSLICQYETVQFEDASMYDATPVSWNFGQNASPSASSAAFPSVFFSKPGLSSITYQSKLGNTTASIIKPVFVVSEKGRSLPIFDDFEHIGGLPHEHWMTENLDKDDYIWKTTNETAFGGTKSLKMDAYGSCGGRSDILIPQSFDFSNYSTVQLRFKTAFAQRQATDNDFLRMFVSTDCGKTWELAWVSGAASLATVAPTQLAFVPSGTADWSEQTVSLNAPSYMKEGTLLRFEFVGRGGNNLFIDDFSVDGDFSGVQVLHAPENEKQGLSTNVLIDWKSVGSVDSYEYQVDLSSDFNTSSLISGTTTYIDENRDNEDTEKLLENLQVNSTYFWRVRYMKDGAPSEWSEVWNFSISETGVGVGDIAEEDIRVFPNPSHDQITVSNTGGLRSITFFDITGRQVLSINPQGSDMYSISTQALAMGSYFVKIDCISAPSVVRNVVIQ